MTRVSSTALRVMHEMARGLGTHHNCCGLSQHGGRSRILRSLICKGLIDRDYHLTHAGRALLKEKGLTHA